MADNKQKIKEARKAASRTLILLDETRRQLKSARNWERAGEIVEQFFLAKGLYCSTGR